MSSETKQATIVLSGDVQYVGFRSELEERLSRYRFSGFVYNDRKDGTVKLVCEGEAVELKRFEDELSAEYPEVRISLEERVILPKPVGRVVVGLEQDIFERLDLGVSRLGSMDERLGSVDTKLDKLNSMDGKLDKLDSMDGTLGLMNGKLDRINGKLNKLDSIDGKLDSMDGKMDSMNGKLNRLESMDGKLDSMDTKLNTLDSMDGKLDTLKDIKEVLEKIAVK